MSATHTITATFADGTTVTRRTDAAYTHASRRQGSSDVRFHTSDAAARRAAGRYGAVVATDFAGAAAATVADDSVRVIVSDAAGHDVGTYTIDAATYRARGMVAAIIAARADGHAASRARRA